MFLIFVFTQLWVYITLLYFILLEMLVVSCPHCNCLVEILELNCRIFRHGVYKENGLQVCPHAPKELCNTLSAESRIHGCGKPFRVVEKDGVFGAEVCDYL